MTNTRLYSRQNEAVKTRDCTSITQGTLLCVHVECITIEYIAKAFADITKCKKLKLKILCYILSKTQFTLKNPTICLWRWEPDRRSNFFFSPLAHLCAFTYTSQNF